MEEDLFCLSLIFTSFRIKNVLFQGCHDMPFGNLCISQSDRYRITITRIYLILSLVVLTIITVAAIKYVSKVFS